MLKRFLSYIGKIGMRKNLMEIEEMPEKFVGGIFTIACYYQITEVELEVLRLGNKDIQIHGKAGDTTLKLKKKVDRALYKRELENANAILGDIKFEEVNGKLYLISFIDLPLKKSFLDVKEAVEDFKRKNLIVKEIFWN